MKYSILFVLVGLANIAFAQSLKGVVVDSMDRIGIALAEVNLVTDNGTFKSETDIDGSFLFDKIDGNLMLLEINSTGYQTKTVTHFTDVESRENTLLVELNAQFELDADSILVSVNVPIVSQDDTTQGQSFSRFEIQHSPLR